MKDHSSRSFGKYRFDSTFIGWMYIVVVAQKVNNYVHSISENHRIATTKVKRMTNIIVPTV